MSRPIVITSSYDVIPKRHWELTYRLVPSIAEVYRYEVCYRCDRLVSDHTWFVINPDTNYVSDCSEVPL